VANWCFETDGNIAISIAAGKSAIILVHYFESAYSPLGDAVSPPSEWKRFGCRWSIWTCLSDISMATKWCWEKQESNEGGLTPPAVFALASENELEYHYLYVRINSSDYQATSDINLVGFWPVPPEFTRIYNRRRSAMGQQGYISLLPAGGDAAAPMGYTLGFATHF